MVHILIVRQTRCCRTPRCAHRLCPIPAAGGRRSPPSPPRSARDCPCALSSAFCCRNSVSRSASAHEVSLVFAIGVTVRPCFRFGSAVSDRDIGNTVRCLKSLVIGCIAVVLHERIQTKRGTLEQARHLIDHDIVADIDAPLPDQLDQSLLRRSDCRDAAAGTSRSCARHASGICRWRRSHAVRTASSVPLPRPGSRRQAPRRLREPSLRDLVTLAFERFFRVPYPFWVSASSGSPRHAHRGTDRLLGDFGRRE